ncbi:hypothetical protein FRC08_018164 [Ceratobasidium sp. 394]|nr:hypothetical protein FRC08_018164 [Ceratobasidium sp. 394]
MRGEHFTLTQDQIEFDSPNYFTSCFLGDFAESRTRTVTLFRDPDLFKIIVEYLNGYQVIPLHESALPKRMSTDAALFNLLADAQFYHLDGLIAQIETDEQDIVLAPSHRLPSYVVISKSWKEGDEATRWSAPVPVPPHTAHYLQATHGIFHQDVVQTWDSAKPEIDKSLRKARLPTSYHLITFWGIAKGTHPVETWEFFYVLNFM